MDSLVGNKIILIDYHNGCMPYVPDDFPSTNNNAVIDIESHVKKIFSDKQLQENSEIDSAFYSLLRTMNREQRTQCILHSDVRIQLKGNVTILHRALKPYVLDRNGDVWLALCAFSFSSRSETGNAIIKMEHSSCHYQYTNGKWEVITNPKLTKIESKILSLSTTGLNVKQIGTLMHLSESTIKSHKQTIFKKLNVANILAAISYVHDYDLW